MKKTEQNAQSLMNIYLENLKALKENVFNLFLDELIKIKECAINFEMSLNSNNHYYWINLGFKSKHYDDEQVLFAFGTGDKIDLKDFQDIDLPEIQKTILKSLLEPIAQLTNNQLFELCLIDLAKLHLNINNNQDTSDNFLNHLLEQYRLNKNVTTTNVLKPLKL